jgi:cysteine synthase A
LLSYHTVVTFLCDGGDRYASRLYNAAWLAEQGLSTGPRGGFAFLEG